MPPDCLSCHKSLSAGTYHPACLKALFNTTWAPRLTFTIPDIPARLRETTEPISSISGVQMKTFVKLNVEKRELEIAPSGGTHILKPDPPQYPELSINENLCMAMAADLDLEVPPHALLKMPDDQFCYVVKRFDRDEEGRKIHTEDLAQVLGIAPDSKYRSSLENIGRAIRKHTTVPGLEALRFFERIVFSYIIGNGDMHLKNWSLITTANHHVQLTPCYDMVSSQVYFNDEDPALTLNGRKNNLKRQDFETLAAYLKIDRKVFSNVLETVQQRRQTMIDRVMRSPLSRDRQEKLSAIMNKHFDVLSIIE